jgi:hypothetical protein
LPLIKFKNRDIIPSARKNKFEKKVLRSPNSFIFFLQVNLPLKMSEKENNKEDQTHKTEFTLPDMLGEDQGNMNNPTLQFVNKDNQSASTKNLPAELQHLFNETNASSSNIQNWNRNDPVSSPHSSNGTPAAAPSPAVQNLSPYNSIGTPAAAPSPVVQNLSPRLNNSQPTSQVTSTHTSTQASPFSNASPQINAQLSPLSNGSPKVSVPQSPLSRVNSSPAVGTPLATTPQQQNSPIDSQTSPQSPQVITSQTQKSSPQIIAARPPSANQSSKVITPQHHIQPIIPHQQQTQSSTSGAQQNGGGKYFYEK